MAGDKVGFEKRLGFLAALSEDVVQPAEKVEAKG